jgi:hypothetical protein
MERADKRLLLHLDGSNYRFLAGGRRQDEGIPVAQNICA